MALPRDEATRKTCLVVAGVGVALAALVCVALLIGLVAFSTDDDADPTTAAGTSPTPIASVEGATEVAGDELLVMVFDVGQAQSVAVIAPNGTSILIDASRSQQRVEDYIVPYLREHGVEQLDYLVLSHPDQDHVGGMPRVLELIPVEHYVDPAIPSTNQTYGETLEMVLDLEIDAILARRGVTLDAGPDVEVELLWPVDPLIESGDEPDTNSNSAVVQVRYGDIEVVDPGDLEEVGEAALVELEGNDLNSEILIAGHHGSRTSTSAGFLDAVDPEVVIISAGFDNPYGHPHPEVLERLRAENIDIYRTDLEGSVEIRIDGQGYEIETLGTEATP